MFFDHLLIYFDNRGAEKLVEVEFQQVVFDLTEFQIESHKLMFEWRACTLLFLTIPSGESMNVL